MAGEDVVGRIVGILDIKDGGFKAAMAGAKGDFTKADAQMSNFAKGAAVAGVAMVAAGTAIAKGVSVAKDSAVAYGSEIIQIQRLTGANAEESSKWAYMLGRFNVTGKAAALVVKSLSVEIASHGKNLKAVGVATQDANGKNLSAMTVLGNLAEAYKNAKDKSAVLAAASKALGRGFTAFIPVLASGRAGVEAMTKQMKDLGLEFSQSNIQQVMDYNTAVKDNQMAMKGLTVQVGLATLPMETWKVKTLGGILTTLREINPELPKLAGGIGSIAAPVMQGAGGLVTFGASISMIAANWGALAAVLAPVAASAASAGSAVATVVPAAVSNPFVAVTVGMLLLARNADKAAQAAKNLDAQSGYVVGTQQKWYQTTKQNADATTRQTGALTSLHQGLAGGIGFLHLHTTALDAEKSAALGTVSATYNNAAAAQKYADAVRAARGMTNGLIGSLLDSVETHKAARKAYKDLKDADQDSAKAALSSKTSIAEKMHALQALSPKGRAYVAAVLAERQAAKAAKKTTDDYRDALNKAAAIKPPSGFGLSDLKGKWHDAALAVQTYITKARLAAKQHGATGMGGVTLASGGVVSGPKSGFPATLHGREAVLPLDNPSRTQQVLREAGLVPGNVIPISASASRPAMSTRGGVIQFNNYSPDVNGGEVVQQINAALSDSGEFAGYRAVMGATG